MIDQDAFDAVRDAVNSWPNRARLVLPGPVDMAPGLVQHIVSALNQKFTLVEAATLREESANLPVFVDDEPPAMHLDCLHPLPKQHAEFINHTRRATPWFNECCPDCQAEYGVHDRRSREIREFTEAGR